MLIKKLFSRTALEVGNNYLYALILLIRGKVMLSEAIRIPMSNFFFRTIYLSDQYKAERFINEDSVVIDVGANIGMFTLKAASLARKGKVFSFEPGSNAFNSLRQNLKKRDNVILIKKAVGSRKSSRLALFKESGFNTMVDTNVFHQIKLKPLGFEDVKMTSLDDFVWAKKIKKIDFIKIDTEGCEIDVLKGARLTIKKFSPVIAVSAYHNPDDKKKIIKLVKAIGPSYKYLLSKQGEEVLFFFDSTRACGKVMIVANVHEPYELGSMLLRNVDHKKLKITKLNTSLNAWNIPSYNLFGKLFYKLFPVRFIKAKILKIKSFLLVKKIKPHLIIVTGIVELGRNFFKEARKNDCIVVNYLTDNPWSIHYQNTIFTQNELGLYDIIFSTKQSMMAKLKKMGIKSFFLPFGYDPTYHKKATLEKNPIADACFVGAADNDRNKYLNQFLKTFKGSFALYGSGWFKYKELNKFYKGVVIGESYRKTVRNCTINIGLVRHVNRDGHVMRTYEIPACGGFGIFEDTKEHREIFKNLPDISFFKNPQDLAGKCNQLIQKKQLIEKIKKLEHQKITGKPNTYADRIEEIISRSNLKVIR